LKTDTGAISLQIVPEPTQASENNSSTALKMQEKLANDIQAKYFKDMDLASCDTHMDTCESKQCNETVYNNKVPIHNSLNVLKQANLTLRVNHLDHGADSQATCAQVTNENLNEMLSTGATEVQSATGMFRLESKNNKTITSIKFFPDY